MYRYFVQPQINKMNAAITGYELFIKQYTKDGWRPPHDFAAIPAHIIADELLAAVERLSLKMYYVSVNLNRTQLINPEISDAIIDAQNKVRPLRLIIEVTEDKADPRIPVEAVCAGFKKFYDRGIDISLDDVDCGENDATDVGPLLPYATELKFALQNFDQVLDDPWLQMRVKHWVELAQKHHLRFVLEGIETEHDDAIADRLGVCDRQGYYYGRPHLLKIAVNDPN